MPHQTQLRVRYEETDRMGVVYHSNYFIYFEVARVEMLRAVGCNYREVEEQGYVLAVLDCAAIFERAASYDDLLTIEAVLTDYRGARLRIDYRILRGEELLVTGHTRHAVLKREADDKGFQTLRTCRPPDFLRRVLELAMTGARGGTP